MKNAIKSLVHKNNNGAIIAIVLAKEWFKEEFILNRMSYFIRKEDYVVCKWFDFHDGEKSNIEGRTTIAICKNKQDAEIIYNNNI